MVRNKRPVATALMATGLLGAAAYTIVARSTGAALGGDAGHGFWVGACIGLELVGVVLLVKSRRTPVA